MDHEEMHSRLAASNSGTARRARARPAGRRAIHLCGLVAAACTTDGGTSGSGAGGPAPEVAFATAPAVRILVYDPTRGPDRELSESPALLDRPTWVVVHGWGHGPENLLDQGLPQALAATGQQVVVIDWSSLGKAAWPAAAAATIGEVAARAATELAAVAPSHIDLVGHSYGARVAHEIACALGSVRRLLALDPTSVGVAADKAEVVLASCAGWSWAFRSSFLGSERLADSAHESFQLYFPWPWLDVNPHNDVNGFLASLLGRHDALSRPLQPAVMVTSERPWRRGPGPEAEIWLAPLARAYAWAPRRIRYVAADGLSRVTMEADW
jgi:hypothetical protein